MEEVQLRRGSILANQTLRDPMQRLDKVKPQKNDNKSLLADSEQALLPQQDSVSEMQSMAAYPAVAVHQRQCPFYTLFVKEELKFARVCIEVGFAVMKCNSSVSVTCTRRLQKPSLFAPLIKF